jgi:hypothetical protein
LIIANDFIITFGCFSVLLIVKGCNPAKGWDGPGGARNLTFKAVALLEKNSEHMTHGSWRTGGPVTVIRSDIPDQ